MTKNVNSYQLEATLARMNSAAMYYEKNGQDAKAEGMRTAMAILVDELGAYNFLPHPYINYRIPLLCSL